MNERYHLYVEGNDDLAVSCQLALTRDELCEPKGRDPRAPKFKVFAQDDKGNAGLGVDHLLRILPDLLKVPTVDRIGLVVDADEDISARWMAIRNVLVAGGYVSTPPVQEHDGTIIEQEHLPRLGIWIWPDNAREGMLEHFIETMIPSGDLLLPQANLCVDEAIRIDRRFPAGHRQKAVIHTWLAWQKTAGRPQGVAIQAKYLDPATDLANRYVEWLVRLFG